MLKYSIVLILILVPSTSGAKAKLVNRIVAEIHSGNEVTSFKVTDERIEMTKPKGKPQYKKLSLKNYEYLVLQFNSLPQTPAECRRRRIDIQYWDEEGKQTTRSSCLGTKSPAAKQYERFVNLLSVAF